MGQVVNGVHIVTISEFSGYLSSLHKNTIHTPYKFNITGGHWGTNGHIDLLIESVRTRGYFLDYSETALSGTLADFAGVFRNCTYLVKSPKIPIGVNNLANCFDGCSSLIEAPEIPQGVTNLEYTFKDCTNLETTPYIPDSVHKMVGCFIGCSNLKHVTNIPPSISSLQQCFKNCISLKEPFTIPATVINLMECFSGCTSLKIAPKIYTHTVFSYVSCFEDCVNLEYVSFITDYSMFSGAPNSFRNIFKNCQKLKGFYVYVPYKEKDETAFYEIKTKYVPYTGDNYSEQIVIYKNGSEIYQNTLTSSTKKTFSAKIYTLVASTNENLFENISTRVKRRLSNFINGFSEVPMLENAVIVGTKDKTNTFIKGVNLE